jgi:hypothetical protein
MNRSFGSVSEKERGSENLKPHQTCSVTLRNSIQRKRAYSEVEIRSYDVNIQIKPKWGF